MRLVVFAGLGLVLAACALVPREFRVDLPDRGDGAPLRVTVVDRVGIVTTVADAFVEVRPQADGVFQLAGSPETLLVTWTGGLCDVAATLTVEERGGALVISEVTEGAGECRAAAVRRDVAIGISRPVDPAQVVFEPSIPGE